MSSPPASEPGAVRPLPAAPAPTPSLLGRTISSKETYGTLKLRTSFHSGEEPDGTTFMSDMPDLPSPKDTALVEAGARVEDPLCRLEVATRLLAGYGVPEDHKRALTLLTVLSSQGQTRDVRPLVLAVLAEVFLWDARKDRAKLNAGLLLRAADYANEAASLGFAPRVVRDVADAAWDLRSLLRSNAIHKNIADQVEPVFQRFAHLWGWKAGSLQAARAGQRPSALDQQLQIHLRIYLPMTSPPAPAPVRPPSCPFLDTTSPKDAYATLILATFFHHDSLPDATTFLSDLPARPPATDTVVPKGQEAVYRFELALRLLAGYGVSEDYAKALDILTALSSQEERACVPPSVRHRALAILAYLYLWYAQEDPAEFRVDMFLRAAIYANQAARLGFAPVVVLEVADVVWAVRFRLRSIPMYKRISDEVEPVLEGLACLWRWETGRLLYGKAAHAAACTAQQSPWKKPPTPRELQQIVDQLWDDMRSARCDVLQRLTWLTA